MDILYINGIRAYGYTGYFAEERTLGQWFEVDLTFWIDMANAGSSDDLNDTLDYSQVVVEVQDLIKASQFKLIERLAEAIAFAVLDRQQVHKVKVGLTKCHPPIPNFSGHVKLEIERSRIL